MISRLIKIYTPFICALVAIIHGVLTLIKYQGVAYYILSEFTGHSILVILYILATSKRFCIWYKRTVYLLLIIHILNLLYLFGLIDFYHTICISLVFNIIALLTFLIYRVTVGITKFLC